jgi:hypothetical protein
MGQRVVCRPHATSARSQALPAARRPVGPAAAGRGRLAAGRGADAALVAAEARRAVAARAERGGAACARVTAAAGARARPPRGAAQRRRGEGAQARRPQIPEKPAVACAVDLARVGDAAAPGPARRDAGGVCRAGAARAVALPGRRARLVRRGRRVGGAVPRAGVQSGAGFGPVQHVLRHRVLPARRGLVPRLPLRLHPVHGAGLRPLGARPAARRVCRLLRVRCRPPPPTHPPAARPHPLTRPPLPPSLRAATAASSKRTRRASGPPPSAPRSPAPSPRWAPGTRTS